MTKFKEPFERLSNIDEAKVIQVIMVRSLVGEGDGIGSPKRQIVEFFSTEGELLARHDNYKDGALEQGVWSSDKAEAPSGKEPLA